MPPDQNPDDLYNALRQRLSNYGQEPPPALWAGIRAQLPPPVATPRRRRWRFGAGWLVAVLALVAVVTWRLQPSKPRPEHSETAAVAAPRAEAPAGRAVKNTRAAPAKASRKVSLGTLKADRNLISASTAPVPAAAASSVSAATAAASEAASAAGPAMAAGGAPISVQSMIASPAPSHRTRKQRQEVALWAGNGVMRQPRGVKTRLEARRLNPVKPGNTDASAAPAAPATSATSATASFKTLTSAAFASTRPAEGAAAGAGSPAVASATRTLDDETGNDAMPTRAFRPRGLTAETADAQPAAWGNALAARPVGLLLSAWPPPAVQLVAVSETSPPPALAAARWSVQFVAGPALTYRRLGSGEAVPPPTTARATAAFSAPAPSMAELERPALGYGGQLSLRRNLTPHWSASFGLGYAEYATRLALQTIRAKPSVAAGIASTAGSALLDSLGRTGASTALHQRDTYRFVTVPLRVGYAWAPNGRWRVGLLAGADAAVYVGGTSTEGAPCACQPQTWGATGSPYRQLSIGLSLGADVRYRLAGRWELLAQPAATYLLLPLARPVAAYAPRHLFGGWAQLGAAFDLR